VSWLRRATIEPVDIEIRQVLVRTPNGEAEWTISPRRVGRDWTLDLVSPTRTWSGAGPDCFEALRQLRAHLDAEHIAIGVNGARPNAWSSGMQRDMGEGLVTYLCELGRPGRPETVGTLDAAPLSAVGTVAQQDEFHARWLTERADGRTLVIGHPLNGRAPLTRTPDGLCLAATGWDDVWSACPEVGVPWRNVRFENDDVRSEIVAAWGTHPDMPS
jgi:hypothetical protein